jgi:spore germination cell wall hydrolase CwlJ-like protein
MGALRTRPKGADVAPFGLAALFFLTGSSGIGHQDLGALLAQKPLPAESRREHPTAKTVATIRAVTFNLPRPVGSYVPEPDGFRLASFDPDEIVTGAIPKGMGPAGASAGETLVYPAVNRSSKGDRLFPTPRTVPQIDAAPELVPIPDLKPSHPDAPPGPGVGIESEDREAATRPEPTPELDLSENELDSVDPASAQAEEAMKFGTARLFFDTGPTGLRWAAIEPWAAGEEPVLMLPRAPVDPDLKRSATIALPGPPENKVKEGLTVAGKGEVTGEGRRPKTPAEHLALQGKARVKAEKCLANAVYFEARSEPVRGQIGVAQVVLNRVFSGFYPDDVCGVVYQNANRYLSCQFTFACDGIPDVVTEPEEWERAKRIARETLDGKLWLKDIGKATHYHASYVYPYWVRSMRKMTRIGLHTFYRPRAWGDGSDEIRWGNAVATADAAAKL